MKIFELDKENLVPWNGFIGVFVVLASFFVVQILAALAIIIIPLIEGKTYKQAIDWLSSTSFHQFIYVFLAEFLTVAVLIGFAKLYNAKLNLVGLRKFKFTDLLYGTLAYIIYFAVFLVTVVIVRLIYPELNVSQKQNVGFSSSAGTLAMALAFISLVILPSIVEEIMVRGFLYGSFKKFSPKIIAALLASLFFGAAHLPEGVGGLLWIGFIDTFILSMTLIYFREKTGGLYAGMFAHGLKNFVAFLSLYVFASTTVFIK